MIRIVTTALRVFEWLKRLDFRPAIARALNRAGNEATLNISAYLAKQTGFSDEAIKSTLKIKEATPENLDYHIDASEIAPPSRDWSRPWDTRQEIDNTRELVKLITIGDERVCPICAAAADHNPYTPDEIKGLRVAGYDGSNGIVHFGCRCMLGKWFGDRPMPVTFGRGGEMPPELLDVRRIGSRIAAEIKLLFKGK